MKSPFLRLASALALLAVSAYAAFTALPLIQGATETAILRYETVSETVPVYGVFLREERVLPPGSPCAGEAQRVSAALPFPQSGIFTAYLDGFEHLSLPMLTVNGIKNLCLDRRMPLSSPGKLITDSAYHFCAITETVHAQEMSIGQACTLETEYFGDIELRLAEKGEAEGDFTALLFTGDRDMDTVMYLRDVSGQLLLSTAAGLRVPDRAIKQDAEGSYVSFLSLGRVQRAEIEPVYDGEGFKLISSSQLYEGCEVIINTPEVILP